MYVCHASRPAAALVLALLSIAANAQDTGVQGTPFSTLVVFSGSLSDTGNYAAANGDLPAPYYQNRTTNGPAHIDIFADKLQLSSAPSLHLVGQTGGTNYAVLHASADGNLPIDLPAQVDAYLAPRFQSADPKALYFIFIGANDIVAATIEPDEQKSKEILRKAMASVESAFRRLHGAGARFFYAPNNVNIGIAPVAREFGVSARATQLTLEFNRAWEEKLRQLERELDVPIFRFDFFRMVEDLLKVTGTFGFTDVTHSCLALAAEGKCDLNRFAFINELLPTRRIHELLGNGLAEALIHQLNSKQCTVDHRCGGRDGTRAYAVIDWPGYNQ